MHLPPQIESILASLKKGRFEAYVVGGSVRDILLKREPKDWDVTTSATPEEIQKIFPNSFYANKFGTVTVLLDKLEVEVTTYRIDGGYSDQRHPDSVLFTRNLSEDLARRDFTINAMAVDEKEIVDPFKGQDDLEKKLIRAVGNPEERFQEDALRLLRAVRFAAQLNFKIEEATLEAIKKQAASITAVSPERIRDELVKLVMSSYPEPGFILLEQTGLLKHVLPELQEGVGVGQNKHHVYTVFEHSIKSCQFAADYDYSFAVRFSALLHDIGKPRTKRPQGNDFTFYSHDIVGAKMAKALMQRLRFSAAETESVTHLIRHHMFYYDIDKVTEAGMRRLLRRVGPEHFDDLIKLRMAERKGSGVPKARPYRLRHLQYLAEKVSQQPLTVGQLKINGTDLMTELKITPGPILGGILNALLADVLEDPAKNTREYLLDQAKELQHLNPADLKARGAQAIEDAEGERADSIKRKYRVY